MSELDMASNAAPSTTGETGPANTIASTQEAAQPSQTQSAPSITSAALTAPSATDTDEIAQMKAKVQQMELEAAKLREQEQKLAEQTQQLGDQQEDIDARSVFVNNVDHDASPEELQQHFSQCGAINRVTILLDKFTGQPKGYAYVEFAEPALVANALVLNETMFRNRTIKVAPKRTNVPGFHRGRGRGRGGFYPRRARGAGRGGVYRGGRGGAGVQTYSPY